MFPALSPPDQTLRLLAAGASPFAVAARRAFLIMECIVFVGFAPLLIQ